MRVGQARAAALRELMESRRIGPGAESWPIEPWRFLTRVVDLDRLPQSETIFSVANGYLGLRGAHDEGVPANDPGVLLNGFYESWSIPYGERAFGFATMGQTIVNATDGTVIRLYVDEEPFDLSTAQGRLRSYERALDMRAGVLERRVEWETPRGAKLRLHSVRLASLEHRHMGAVSYRLTLLEGKADLAISSELVTHGEGDRSDDPRRGGRPGGTGLIPVDRSADGTRVALELATQVSGLSMACGMEHRVEAGDCSSIESSVDADAGRVTFLLDAEPGTPVMISKFLAYHYAAEAPKGDLQRRVHRTLDRAQRDGFDRIAAVQRERLDAFWESSDVVIDGPEDVQQAVRFSLFQIRQASARVEGHGIPAKGLTGRGYEGQYFWDSEIYVLPVLTYTQPHVARRLLRFRHQMLPAARRHAKELGQRGAMFPWRTISGEEASAYYAAGTAQYHINADIVHAMRQHFRATGDADAFVREGIEVVVETARLWEDLGFFSERRDGEFCILGVTGPDEYSAVVDNNAYTNLMARENMIGAADALEWLRERDGGEYARLVAATNLDPDEPLAWRRAAERMRVPYDTRAGVFLQDDSFLDREPWDFDGTPLEKYPLLLHFHPLTIYRSQIIKQTDVVLATFLLTDRFTLEEKRRIFDYYDPLTTADSSLSACVQSIMASEVGEPGAAYQYFLLSAAIDLADLAGNAADGIHVASCGGVWMALVHGFAGLRETDDELRFSPRLPEEWSRMRFRLAVRGQSLEVDMRRDGTTYRLLEGAGLEIVHDGEPLSVAPGDGVSTPPAAWVKLPSATRS